jgi:hypothetical protein
MVNEPEPAKDFEQRSKALFDDSVEQLNGNIRSRLTQARHHAVAEAGTSRLQASRRFWLPAAGLAATALTAALIVMPYVHRDHGLPEAFAAADDMVILMNSDDLEMLKDMDFYAWMDGDADAADEVATPDADVRS